MKKEEEEEIMSQIKSTDKEINIPLFKVMCRNVTFVLLGKRFYSTSLFLMFF